MLPYNAEQHRKQYFNGTKKGIRDFVYNTEQAEFGHLGAFVVILALSFLLLNKDYYTLVICMNIINIIGNFYPVVLQRLHRLRIEKIVINPN